MKKTNLPHPKAAKRQDRTDEDPTMDRRKSSVDQLLESEQGRREFTEEELAFEATEKIAELMEATNVTKSELAKRTGKSKAYITQVLSGSRNMTLHTLAGLAYALGYKISLDALPVGTTVITEVVRYTTLISDEPINPKVVLAQPGAGAPAANRHRRRRMTHTASSLIAA
jgi:transcriptional regulator with XRE-family HTH domain